MLRILLVRHGETNSNKNKIIMGNLPVPLNERGISQANQCGEYLREKFPNIKTIYSSTLIRAKETSQKITEKLNLDDEIIFESSLAERSFGILEGTIYNELDFILRDKFGKFDVKTVPEGGESGIQFYRRVRQGINRIIDNHINFDHTILIISHGGTIRHILGSIFLQKENEYKYFPIDINNCSITELIFEKGNINSCTAKYINFYQYLV
jgi:broad specificity phosphatase PhoE